MSKQPICHVIAGPNGAGKTTFALRSFQQLTGCRRYLNVDLILRGLYPIEGVKTYMERKAGRLFLEMLASHIVDGDDFAFETTLSGRGHLRTLDRVRAQGFRIHMYFMWIPSEALSAARVAQRVRQGGHDVPLSAIERRYSLSIKNLLTEYMPKTDRTEIINSSNLDSGPIATYSSGKLEIHDDAIYADILERAEQ